MFVVHCSDDIQGLSRSFKLEWIKGYYCVGFVEVLFVNSKMILYPIQSTANRSIDNKHPESLQRHPESLQKIYLRPPIRTVELIACSKY